MPWRAVQNSSRSSDVTPVCAGARWSRDRESVRCRSLGVRRRVDESGDARFVEDQSLNQLRLPDRHHETDRRAIGPANQSHRFELKRPDEGREILSVGADREVRPVVGPRRRAEVALRRRDDSKTGPDALCVRCPDPVIRDRAVHEDNGRAGPVVEEGAIDACAI